MNILILHRIPYGYMRYADTIDHARHRVYYVGVEGALANLPADLRCTRIPRPGRGPVFAEVIEAVAGLGVAFDMVIALSEYELMDGAKVRAHLGVPGPTPSQVEKVRDKTVMKRHVQAAGIPAPRFVGLERWAAGARLELNAGRGVVLKPIDGASSTDVVIYPDQGALAEALRRRRTGIADLDRDDPRYRGYEVEEFIDGDVLHFDGVVVDGAIRVLVVSRYVDTLLDFANGKPAGSVQIELDRDAEQWVRAVLEALELRRGVFHLEAFDSPDGLVFLEIAGRTGGARIVETFQLKTGVHLPTADLSLQVDPTYDLAPHVDPRWYFAWFLVPGHQLAQRFCRVTGHEFLRGRDEVVCLNELAPDTEPAKHITYVESELPLAGLLRGERSEDLIALLRELFARIDVQGCDRPAAESRQRVG